MVLKTFRLENIFSLKKCFVVLLLLITVFGCGIMTTLCSAAQEETATAVQVEENTKTETVQQFSDDGLMKMGIAEKIFTGFLVAVISLTVAGSVTTIVLIIQRRRATPYIENDEVKEN